MSRPSLPSLLGLPVLLALALLTAGCPDTEGTAAADGPSTKSPLAKPSLGPDHGPSPNAPKLDSELVNPQVMEAPSGKYGGNLTLPAFDDPKTFNPAMVADGESQRFLAYIFDALLDVDSWTGKVIPSIAEAYDVSKDGRVYTLHLRHGARWHDLQPITADDVVFTWGDIMNNEEIPFDGRDAVKVNGKLPVVKKIDAHTVTFTLPQAFAPFVRSGLTGVQILPKHIMGPWLAKGTNGKPILNTKWGVDSNVKEIVGSGPFMFSSYSAGQRIVLKRFDHYYRVNHYKQPLPYLDTLTFPFLKDPDTVLLKFKSGETDYATVYGKDFPYMKPLEGPNNFTIYDAGPRWTEYYMSFNLNPEKNKSGQPCVDPVKLKWFADRRFRQAVSLGIDRTNIIRNVFRGLAVEQNSPIFQKSPFYDPSTPAKLPYDPKKALALLQEAGFRKDGDVLKDRDGHPVKFSILSQTGFKEGELEVNNIRDDLKDLGMDVSIMAVTFNVATSLTHDAKQWEAEFGVWGAGLEPNDVAGHWNSNGQGHMFDLNPGKKPNPHYAWEKEIDHDFQLGAVTIDEAKRKAIYNHFQQVVEREQPEIYLPDLVRAIAMSNTVGNARPVSLSDLGAGWNAYELYRK